MTARGRLELTAITRYCPIGLALIFSVGACAAPSANQAVPSSASASAAASASSARPQAEAWSDTLTAARREGQVVVVGQGGQTIEEALATNFKKAYPEINVVYTGASGAEVSAKVLTERQAGRYTNDVIIHGTNTILTDLMGSNSLDPLAPFLTGPEVQDSSKWLDGKFRFADDAGKFNLVFTTGVKSPLNYSPNQVSASELTSYRSLLDPKWKGKIGMFDPRIGGAGIGFASFLYAEPSLGKEFMSQLFPNVIFTRDIRQLADWVARGQYPIAIGTDEFTALELKQKGVPIELLPGSALKEGTYATASWGSVGVLSKAPHPNATRVYLNWLLSKDGLEGVSRASGYPTRRTDVSTSQLLPALIPTPGLKYIENYTESFVRIQREVQALVPSLIPS